VIEVRFTKDATNALVQQALYIFEQTKNIKIADRYLDDMKDFITSMLSTFPKAGRPAEEFGKGVRKLVYQRYSILYKIVDSEYIIILTLYRENISKF
jgi:plasmid stabilization system protein ParE